MRARDRDNPFTPIVVTILASICWALLMMFYVLFWAKDFDWLQSIAIILLSLFMTGCVIGLMWVYWIFRRA